MVKTNLIPSFASANAPALAGPDIRGIKAPVPIPNLWLWVALALGVLAVGALAWWWWRKQRLRAALPTPVILIPADEKARAKLQEALALLTQPRPFCILVSDTIRGYLEERFNLRAPERTTEEFLEELQSSALLNHEQKRTLGEFLMRCDLVKFARYEPSTEELKQIYDVAVRLVDETKSPPPSMVAQPGAVPAAVAQTS